MSTKELEARLDKHTRSMLSVHMVFSPKYRGQLLVGSVAHDLEGILCELCKEMDIRILDIAVNPEHVHLFLQYPPKYSASDIAKRLKGNSSRRLREMHPRLKIWNRGGLWSKSCFHGSVGHGVDVVAAYIQAQEKHHGKRK